MYHVKFTMINPLLGSQSRVGTVASDFIRSKVNESQNISDEVETLPKEMEKGTTGFHRVDGKPCLFNYHVKGMLKDAASVFNGVDGIKALRSKITDLVFISPRIIPIIGEEDKPLERPLQAMTMQGPRVSLARSEQIKAGAYFECDVDVIKTVKTELKEELLRKLLDYAMNKGFGQWRTSGAYGQFTYELTVSENGKK